MVVRSFVACIAAFVVACAAPTVSAAPIEVAVTATNVGELEVGQSATVPFTVSVNSNDNIVCPQGGSITINLEAQRADESLGFGAAALPTSMSFAIDAGAYTTATGAWAPDDQTGEFTVTLDAAKVPNGHGTHLFNLVATYPGGTGPGACQTSASTWGEASANIEIAVNPIFPDVPTGPTGGTNPTGPTGPTQPTGGGGDSEDSPGVAFVPIALALALLVAFVRRR